MTHRAYAWISSLVLLTAAATTGCSVDPIETVDGSGRGGSAASGHGGSSSGASGEM